MTNQQILTKLYAIAKAQDDDKPDTAGRELMSLISGVQENIRLECVKNKGVAKKDTLIKKIMNNKNCSNIRNKYWNKYSQFVMKDGKCVEINQCGFLDGYRLYVLNNDFGYPSCEQNNIQSFDIKAAIPDGCTIPLVIDIADLKAYVKNIKAMKGKFASSPYILKNGEFEIAFNPEYLLEFCQMFDTSIIYSNGNNKSPIFYENKSNNEFGLLCPVRLNKNK